MNENVCIRESYSSTNPDILLTFKQTQLKCHFGRIFTHSQRNRAVHIYLNNIEAVSTKTYYAFVEIEFWNFEYSELKRMESILPPVAWMNICIWVSRLLKSWLLSRHSSSVILAEFSHTPSEKKAKDFPLKLLKLHRTTQARRRIIYNFSHHLTHTIQPFTLPPPLEWIVWSW